MPENVANSTAVVEKQRKIRDMRRKAVSKILGRPEDEAMYGSFGTTDHRKGVSKAVHRIRVRRKDKHGHEIEEDVNLEERDSDEEIGRLGRLRGKKKQTRKDVWVGQSFDIGQEFHVSSTSSAGSGVTPLGEGDGPTANGIDDAEARSEHSRISNLDRGRPAPSRGTTQETFVTAKTHVASDYNDSSSMIANLDQSMDDSSPPLIRSDPDYRPSGSDTISLPPNIRNSQGSSIQPLISRDQSEPRPRPDDRSDHDREGRDLVTPVKKAPGFKNRFKSAVKQSPGGSTELNSIASPLGAKRANTVPNRLRSKSVQFNTDPVMMNGGGREPPRRGNKEPADPRQVLKREGSAVAGTSAGAVEETVVEEEEETARAGQIIMRGE